MVEVLTVAAIVAATAAVRLRVTVVADVLLRAAEHRTAVVAHRTVVADPRTAADRHTVAAHRMVADRHTGAAVAADMEGKNTLDCFPA